MKPMRYGMVSVESLLIIAVGAIILLGLKKYWHEGAQPQARKLIAIVLGDEDKAETGRNQVEVVTFEDDYDENEWHPDDRISWEQILGRLASLADTIGSGVGLGGTGGKLGQAVEVARDFASVSDDWDQGQESNLRKRLYGAYVRRRELKDTIAKYRRAIVQLSKVQPKWPDLVDTIEKLSEINDSLKAELESINYELNSEPLRSERWRVEWERKHTA